MKISSHNEWSPLRSVIVGMAAGANKPDGCHFEHPGAYPGHVTAQADMDLDRFARTLEQEGVKVHRPKYHNFSLTGGMYNYCPRDRLLVVGNTVVDCNMQYACREQESSYYDYVLKSAKRVITVPRNRWVSLMLLMFVDWAKHCYIYKALAAHEQVQLGYKNSFQITQ